MQLTKEQITFIDNYLKEKGVKYWDVRLEMIDHAATKVEQNKELDLNEEFLKKEFGPYYKINRLVNEKKRLINKKYRNEFFKNIPLFFKSSKNLILFLVFFFIYFQSHQLFNSTLFKRVSILLLFIPVIISLYFFTKDLFQFKKSIHIEIAYAWMTFPFIFLNGIIQLTNPDIFNIPVQVQLVVIMVTTPF